MTRPTDPLSDEQVGELLTRAFAAHELLADPDRAVAIAASPGRRRHPARVLLGAAAAVALVAAGTSYALSRGAHRDPRTPPGIADGTLHEPPLPVQPTSAQSRASARRAADRMIGRVPIHAGARTSPPIPALRPAYVTFGVTGRTVTRTRWWTVTGATASAVAGWYAAHPAPGLVSDGRVASTTRTGGPTVSYATFSSPGRGERRPTSGVHVVVEVTSLAAGVGVRVTVESLWPPARPAASFVQDVSSIDVKQTQYQRLGKRFGMVVHHYTAADQPDQVMAAARAFDGLIGMNPVEFSCPMTRASDSDQITFHTATGDVVAVTRSSACGSGVTVYRDGRQVGPQLGYSSPLLDVLHLKR